MFRLSEMLKKSGETMRHGLFSKPLSRFSNSRFSNVPLYYYLIGANIGIFGIRATNTITFRSFVENFTFSKKNFLENRYHTIITHGFAHERIFHLLSNMVGLYFFGKTIEQIFGGRALARLYIGGTLLGAAFILFEERRLQNNSFSGFRQERYHLGASSGVYAILTNFALYFPNQKIYLYFIPVPAWILIAGLLGYTTFYYGANDSTTSHAGHLGGIAWGAAAFLLSRRGFF